MTEQVEPKGSPEAGGEQQQEQVVEKEYSPVEQEAMSQGWVPKEEFNGDEGKWVEAGEFIRRGELFKKIDTQGREIKGTKEALKNLQDHYVKMKNTEYQRALADLKKEYKLANREGDFEKADSIEEKMEEVEQEKAAFVQEQAKIVVDEPAAQHPLFQQWVSRNAWYSTEPHMRVYADRVGVSFAGMGKTPEEVLKLVDEAVHKEFPTKFKNPNRDRPGSTESPSAKGGKKQDSFELTPQQRKIMNNFVEQKVMTKEEYIASLKQIQGVA